MVANARDSPTTGSTTVDRGVFSDDIVIAYFEPGRLSSVFEILRVLADRSKLVDLVVLANFRGPLEHNMWAYPTTLPNRDIGSDNGVRTHLA